MGHPYESAEELFGSALYNSAVYSDEEEAIFGSPVGEARISVGGSSSRGVTLLRTLRVRCRRVRHRPPLDPLFVGLGDLDAKISGRNLRPRRR